jgi:hypothetical protein
MRVGEHATELTENGSKTKMIVWKLIQNDYKPESAM